MNAIVRSRSFGIALVGASLVALVLSGYSSIRTQSYAQCQSMVSELLIQATDARARAAEEDRQSDRQESEATAILINAVFSSAGQADLLAAYANYQKTLQAINERRAATAKEREAHPIPDPPSQVCT